MTGSPPPGFRRPDEWVTTTYYQPVDEPATLRDRFAMAALTGLLANDGTSADAFGGLRNLGPVVARTVYAIADACLAARERKEAP